MAPRVALAGGSGECPSLRSLRRTQPARPNPSRTQAPQCNPPVPEPEAFRSLRGRRLLIEVALGLEEQNSTPPLPQLAHLPAGQQIPQLSQRGTAGMVGTTGVAVVARAAVAPCLGNPLPRACTPRSRVSPRRSVAPCRRGRTPRAVSSPRQTPRYLTRAQGLGRQSWGRGGTPGVTPRRYSRLSGRGRERERGQGQGLMCRLSTPSCRQSRRG